MITDQIGRVIQVSGEPQKVISLVPSQTEFLVDAGIGSRLVGCTKFCVHPPEIREMCTSVGGTKKLHFDTIYKLKPDFILANKEENNKEDILKLEKDFPVWVSDVKDFDSSIEMMAAVGLILNLEVRGLIQKFKDAVEKIEARKKGRGSAIYLIWNQPIMAAGKYTFIDYVLDQIGFKNVILDSRYPEITEDQLKNLNPHSVLLSSEPYPFKEKHMKTFQELLPQSQILLVDGEAFSWYGTRIIKKLDYLLSGF